MSFIQENLIRVIPEIQSKIINYAKRNNQLLRTLDDADLNESYWDGVTGLIEDPSGKPVLTQKELETALIARTEASALQELNQRRNDQKLLDGYTGMSLSRQEYFKYPEKFIKILPERQSLLARCRNMRLYYTEIAELLNLKGIDGQMGAINAKFKKWGEQSPIAIDLAQDELKVLEDPTDLAIIQDALEGLKIGHTAKRLGLNSGKLSRRKYQLLQQLGRIKKCLSQKLSTSSREK